MQLIDKINDSTYQSLIPTGLPGLTVTMALRYMPRVNLWNMDIAYGDFAAKGLVITTGPNMLRNWRNILPFGITCATTDGLDPYYSDDFQTRRAQLYSLNAYEVLALEEWAIG